MNRIALLLVLLSAPAFAQEVVNEEPDQDKPTAEKTAKEVAVEAPAKDLPVLDLVTALQMARASSPASREQAAKIRKAEWQQFRAKYAWAPKLQSTFAFSLVPSDVVVDDFGNSLDKYVNLNFGPYLRNDTKVIVPLYTFDRISIAQDLAAIGVDVAKLRHIESDLDITFEVNRAYCAAQLSQAFSEILKEVSDILKPKLAEMAEDREFGGTSFSTKDFRKLQIADAEFDGRVIDNQKLELLATEGLLYFTAMKTPFSVPALSESQSLVPPKPVAHYLDLARQFRPDLKLLAKALEARGLAVDMARSNFYPNLAFAASFGFGVSTETIGLKEVCRKPSPDAECIDTNDLYARPYSNPLDFLSVTFGLGLEWNIDFVQTYGKFREADEELAETRAQRDRALGAIELDIKRLHSDAQAAYDKVQANERRLDAARRWRDQFGLSVQTAGADIADGIDPLRAHVEARVALLQARYDYFVAQAALAKGVGVHDIR